MGWGGLEDALERPWDSAATALLRTAGQGGWCVGVTNDQCVYQVLEVMMCGVEGPRRISLTAREGVRIPGTRSKG